MLDNFEAKVANNQNAPDSSYRVYDLIMTGCRFWAWNEYVPALWICICNCLVLI